MAATLDAQIVHADDVYPGWEGMAAGCDSIIDCVLVPFRHGNPGEFTRWDWHHDRPGALHDVPLRSVLIIEGCGINTPRARALADVVIWVDCDDVTRNERLAARDGDRFAAFATTWDRQVDEHIQSNDPIATATVRVAG